MAKIAVVLSGCGVYDGAEIHESVLSLLHLSNAGAEVTVMAPDIDQLHVINHQTGEETDESRNVLIESARISRGPVVNIAEANPAEFDAVLLPGGFGAAKNLCNFALKGPEGEVQKDLKSFLIKAHDLGRPIGALCIAPALLALLGKEMDAPGLKLTIGTDPEVGAGINSLGCEHVNLAVTEVCYDEKHRILTSPAYMLGQNISEVNEGIEKLIKKLLDLVS